jgi:hypothetical protein
VTQKQRWPSMRASAARKGTKSAVNGAPASSQKSRAKAPPVGELKIRSVSGVQTFFKERTLSKADAYIRDRTASEGHIFLKALAPEAPFLDVMPLSPLPPLLIMPFSLDLNSAPKICIAGSPMNCSNSANVQLKLCLVSFSLLSTKQDFTSFVIRNFPFSRCCKLCLDPSVIVYLNVMF